MSQEQSVPELEASWCAGKAAYLQQNKYPTKYKGERLGALLHKNPGTDAAHGAECELIEVNGRLRGRGVAEGQKGLSVTPKDDGGDVV